MAKTLKVRESMLEARLAGGILCPVDLSGQSSSVVRLAASLANACSVPLVLVHTLKSDVPPYFTQGGVERLETELEQTRSAARQKLALLVQEAGPIPEVEIRVEDGDPVSVIRRLSQSLRIAMIVMGTHKRSGLARIEEGSIAEDVVRSSTIPVLTVGPGDRIVTPPLIICAVTDSPLSHVSLSWAVKMAQCLGTHLTVLHVVEPGIPTTISDLCAWVGHDRPPGCHIQEVTRHGNPVEEILGLASELGAGLLIIGAEHKLISDKTVIGATAEKLVRQSPCPVLTVLGR
ncbi:MAG TPA: universal stress protein [Bryobacteraceae bacterium]|nr:universal stress protein [Bryobacteraceae bacterium]